MSDDGDAERRLARLRGRIAGRRIINGIERRLGRDTSDFDRFLDRIEREIEGD